MLLVGLLRLRLLTLLLALLRLRAQIQSRPLLLLLLLLLLLYPLLHLMPELQSMTDSARTATVLASHISTSPTE